MGKKSKNNKKKGGGRSRKGSTSPKPNKGNNNGNENQFRQQEPQVTNHNVKEDQNKDKPTNNIQDEMAAASARGGGGGGDVSPPVPPTETKQHKSENVMEVQQEGNKNGGAAAAGEEVEERPTMARKNASIYTSARTMMDDNEMKEVEDTAAAAAAAAVNSSSPEQQQQQQPTDNNARQSVYYDAAEGVVDGISESSEKKEEQGEEDNDSSGLLDDEVSNGNSQPDLVDGLAVTAVAVTDAANTMPPEVGDDDIDVDSDDVDPDDAPSRFADLESAYSWFADHAAEGPTVEEPSEVEIVFSSRSSTEDSEEKKDEILDDNAQPLKVRRNSLIGRVKTVNADGDTADEEEDDYDDDGQAEEEEDPWVIRDSNLRNPNRRICVVTTAALPWRTGTAVNPLLRALYLTRGRPKHYVTLVIPWCQEEEDRNKTLGRQHSFSNQTEQEEWIRDFCRTRANCVEEEKNLKIMFYSSNYNESMGSIFPSVDICALIPDNEADVAILEEPEHLNWLRVPTPYLYSDDEEKEKKEDEEVQQQKTSKKGSLTKRRHATAKEKQELGWRFKFRHVVGIIHTNYKAYAEQYGIGAKFITAPALCALNALVVRAYCHKVILLSGTLPSLTPYKEITCNVHGVRGEFLERPTDTIKTEERPEDDEGQPAPVYFIGKLIWAKGFDKILDLENLYREKHEDYFPIDVYGAGGDEKAIKRAFYGRIPQIQQRSSSDSDEGDSSASEQETAEVFTWETSLRSHLVEQSPFKDSERHASLDEHMAKQRSILDPDDEDDKDDGKNDLKEPPETPKKRGNIIEELAENVVPLSVLGNLSVSALDTTKATGGAAVEIVKNVVGAGLNVAFTNDVGSPKRKSKKKVDGPGSPQKAPKQKLIFEPPQSIFEFRRNPIQARFLGTKDHVLLRDMKEHKVFLNMSITEVLCTTSAEALAMGKFVIVPKHPSNTFFYQFPNCLAYTSLEDCLEKLEWALANDPVPLSEESAQKLSWEGANERLFDSAAVTRDEWEEWAETGKLKSDADAARFHVETGMTGQLIGKFFTGNKSKEETKVE